MASERAHGTAGMKLTLGADQAFPEPAWHRRRRMLGISTPWPLSWRITGPPPWPASHATPSTSERATTPGRPTRGRRPGPGCCEDSPVSGVDGRPTAGAQGRTHPDHHHRPTNERRRRCRRYVVTGERPRPRGPLPDVIGRPRTVANVKSRILWPFSSLLVAGRHRSPYRHRGAVQIVPFAVQSARSTIRKPWSVPLAVESRRVV